MSLRWNLRRGFGRWLCAFLVLVAMAYAMLPDGGPPLARASGSAFSAATSDVAVGCTIRPEIDRRVWPDRPAPPPLPRCAVSVAILAPVAVPASLPDGHHSRAPPASLRALLTPLGSRAPPAV